MKRQTCISDDTDILNNYCYNTLSSNEPAQTHCRAEPETRTLDASKQLNEPAGRTRPSDPRPRRRGRNFSPSARHTAKTRTRSSRGARRSRSPSRKCRPPTGRSSRRRSSRRIRIPTPRSTAKTPTPTIYPSNTHALAYPTTPVREPPHVADNTKAGAQGLTAGETALW